MKSKRLGSALLSLMRPVYTEPPWWGPFVAEMTELGCQVGPFDDATGEADIRIPEGVLEAAKAIMARYKDPNVGKL